MLKRLVWVAIAALITALGILFWAHESELRATKDALVATEALSEARARDLELTRLKVANQDELRKLVASIHDGEKVAKQTRAKLGLSGSTKRHVVSDAPPDLGEIAVTNKATAAIVTLPDGRPYAKGEVTTTLEIPRFKLTRVWTEPLHFESALIDAAAAGPPCSEKPDLHVGDTAVVAQAKHYHLGKGWVCGLGVTASVSVYPLQTAGGGLGVGAFCGYGWGIVK